MVIVFFRICHDLHSASTYVCHISDRVYSGISGNQETLPTGLAGQNRDQDREQVTGSKYIPHKNGF